MFSVSTPRSRRFLATVATLVALAVSNPQPLRAQADRESTYPTEWSAAHTQSVANIQAKRAAGYRIVTMDYRGVLTPTFAVTYVHNSGEYYQRGATWYYGTPAFIASNLSGRRITELEPYITNNTLYFAAVMVDNAGSQAKSWWWYYGTASHIASQLSGKRIVDLDAYRINGTVYYSAVMIANTGADYRDWWWYTNVTENYIVGRALGLGAQILDAERFGYGSSDEHCAVLARHPSEPVPGHAWYNWKDWDQVSALLAQNRARPVKIESVGFLSNGTHIYNLLLIENRASIEGFGRSCAGTSGTPRLSFSGTPKPGGYANLRLGNAEPNQPVVVSLGFSNASWGRASLPINLAGVGAPGCYLYTEPTITIPLATNAVGTLSWTLNIPTPVSLGTRMFAQMFCSDRRANTLGVTSTSAVEIRVGQ